MVVLCTQSRVACDQLPDQIRHKSEMMPKGKFLGIVYGTAIVFNVALAGVTVLVSLPSKRPLSNLANVLNVPNKDYWLETPERLRAARAKMSCGLLWFCLVLNGVFWYCIDLTLRSERAGSPQPVSVAVICMILAGFCAGFVFNYYAFRQGKQAV